MFNPHSHLPRLTGVACDRHHDAIVQPYLCSSADHTGCPWYRSQALEYWGCFAYSAVHIAWCNNSIHHIENRFSPNFILFCFLMQFGLWRAAAFVSSPIHLLSDVTREQYMCNMLQLSTNVGVLLKLFTRKIFTVLELIEPPSYIIDHLEQLSQKITEDGNRAAVSTVLFRVCHNWVFR